jgi:indole-3-glycerol phosphate synthase
LTTYLDKILEAHRVAAVGDQRDVDELARQAAAQPAARGFRRALANSAKGGQLAVIAEVKRRSPSAGDLLIDLDPAAVAASYETGGASCLSVLTDVEFFGGSADDLTAARAATRLPVLRKDFTVTEADVYDARIMGADALLLIVAALDDDELGRFHRAATELGIDALVEVHDEAELERAMRVGATLVGVNQRDLVTFEVDTDRAVRVAAAMPDDVIRVAESGIRNADDAHRLRDAGYHAVLVGESLVKSGDPSAAVAAIRQGA